MRKVAVFTGTRSEYGILYWLLKDIEASEKLDLQLIVSAMHLSPEFGLTVDLIERDGFEISEKVEMLLSSNTSVGVAKSVGLGVIGYADALARLQPDVLVVLGDRFELLAIVQTAMLFKIPILHLHGGEVTEGAYDDAIRHAITKLSSVHCASLPEYCNRIVQMGESPERVHCVGALALDHLFRSQFISRQELSHSLDFKLDSPYFLVTYHPVTLANEAPVASFKALLRALDAFPDYKVILTYPNADNGGRDIVPLIENYAQGRPARVLAIPSLGQVRYLSSLKYAAAVIGNSSSGIIEVPSFHVPTVNIGERQKGRISSRSVIHCEASMESISVAIKRAVSDSFLNQISNADNPYGRGDASSEVLSILESMDLSCTKSFYDLDFAYEGK